MVKPRRLSVGDLSFLYQPGLIRRLEIGGTEVVRMISAPVRDENWGTFAPTFLSTEIDEADDVIGIDERFSVADGGLLAHLVFKISGNGTVSATLDLTGSRDVQTNRAGFTLLHPIAGIIGTDLSVTHSDGSVEPTRFPEPIAPGQPAIDIAGLAHHVDGVDVHIAFGGETFETEDQRNWSDASFKTYCHPLSLPFPYTIARGETVTQRIDISLNRTGTAHVPPSPSARQPTLRLPRLCLAVEPDWLAGPLPEAMTPLLRFTGPDSWSGEKLTQIAATHRTVDVEIMVPDGEIAETVLATIHAILDAAGLTVAHVTALPEAYLASHQPSGPWPKGLLPEACAKAARQAFPDARIGVGMLTHFTEFNRRPPDTSLGDYVTYANTAIVHAADDLSVWETLETLPHVFRSARALSGGLPTRLGLVSIAMRSNPYGEALVANPAGARIAMSGVDPRQTQPFAAAYAVAAYALAAQAGVEAIVLAAPSGRLGMADENGALRPIGEALMALAALGHAAELGIDGSTFTLRAAGKTVFANASGDGTVHTNGFGDSND